MKKKWGKIGAPRSATRKKFLAGIRKKGAAKKTGRRTKKRRRASSSWF